MKRRRGLWVGLILAIFGTAALLVGSPDTLAWLRGWPSLEDPGPAFDKADEETWPRFILDNEKGRVLKEQAPGKVEWITPAPGNHGQSRPPHNLVFDAERVYYTQGDGVTALDARSGKCLWHSPGPQDLLCLSGDLLLAAGDRLLARSVKTGEAKFEVALENPQEVRLLADLFLVQGGKYWPMYFDDARLVDHQGHVRYHFNREVINGVKLDDDYVFLTSKDVTRRSPTDEERWSVPFGPRGRHWTGGLMVLPDGDLLAFGFGPISDSGVHVMRIHPQSDEQVWQAYCDGLRVMHSVYRHQVKVEICKGRYLKVMSEGSSGSFAELIDLPTGQRLSRKEFGRPAKRHWLLEWLFGK